MDLYWDWQLTTECLTFFPSVGGMLLPSSGRPALEIAAMFIPKQEALKAET
jgi:hypothetical protein